MSNAIEVSGLRKVYGPLAAVDGIDFQVPTGEVFAFLGPNGAGKTTTVEILEGIRQATEGTVRVLGRDPWRHGGEVHREIGVIPQEFRFFDKITPKEAIEYYGVLFRVPVDAPALLKRVYLDDKSSTRFEHLSGGQKQKLGLALSLVSNPKICFLDEPTTGLDPQARRAIWEVIRQLRAEGRTVFLTTHYLEEAELLADQVAIINHGKIIAHGTAEDIIRKFGRPDRLVVEGPPSLAQYLSTHLPFPVLAQGDKIEVHIASKADVATVLGAVNASGLPWTGFGTVRDTLDDVFVHMVGTMDEGVLKPSAAA